ncbi:unnamed protein product, partial [Staurois parvus]
MIVVRAGDRHRSSGSLITSAPMIGAQQCHTQLPVLGCTFLMLSEREESTAENRQL